MAAPLSALPRALRGLLIALAALLAAVGLCEALGWPFLKGPLQRLLQQNLGREVSFGERFELRLLGPVRLRADRFTIGPPAWAEGELRRPLLQAEGAFLQLPWSTLRAARRGEGPLRIAALEVDRLDALLHREADGRANWQFRARPEGAASSDAELPQFERLAVRQGRIDWIDRPLKLALQAEASTQEGRQAAPGGGLRISARGRYRDEPVALQLTSSGALPLLAPDEAGTPVPIALKASSGASRLGFDGQVVDVLRLAGLQGRVTLAGDSLAEVGDVIGVTLPSTAAFETEGRLRHVGRLWQADLGRLDVGRSRLVGRFAFDTAPRPPRLDGELRGRRLVLADLAPAVGARNQPEAPRPAPAGRVLPQREFDIPSLKAMNAQVKIDLQELQLGEVFREPVQPLRGVLQLQDGVLRLDQLLARTAGGELGGRIALDARQKTPRWDTELRWNGIRLERWLRPRNPFAAEARAGKAPPPFVSGVLGGRAQLRGTGRSTAALLGSLDGEATAWVREGRMSHLLLEAAGLDIAESLGLVFGGDGTLPVQCAVAQVRAKDGELRPEVMLVDTPDTLVLVEGGISLRREAIALRLSARPKDMSPLSLRAPLHVEGSFSDPAVRPDLAAIGGKALAAAALAALVTPLAALIPLIDPGSGDTGGCRQAVGRLGGRAPASPEARR